MATITANNGAAGNFQDGSSWVGGVAPTAADDAILPVGCTSMTIGTGSVCRSFTATAFTGTLTHTAGVDFRIGDGTAGAGNVALAFGTFTYTLGSATTSLITFISTSATVQTVNFNGKTTGNVTFNATSNGSWQYTGGHVTGATATVTLTKGTLDINGQTCSWGKFDSNNTNTRTLTLGAANITCTGTATSWNFDNPIGATFNSGNTTLTITGSSAQIVPCPFGMSWTGTSTIVVNNIGGSSGLYGSGWTVVNLTLTGTAIKTGQVFISENNTILGTFTCNGNSPINRILLFSLTVGTARTITAATWVVTNTDFQDITGAGAGSRDFSAQTDVGDCGGNSGITFPASVAQTWSGTSGGNWSTNAWTTRVPLPQDDVSLGVDFSASQTVTADMPRLGRSIDWTGATGSPTWANSVAQSIYGNLVLISGMAISGTNLLTLAGRGNFTIISSGVTFVQAIDINAPNGAYTLGDALTCLSTSSGIGFRITNGGFVNSGNYSCSLYKLSSNNSNTRTITLGSATYNISDISGENVINLGSTGLTFSGASSIINLSTTSVENRIFAGSGLTFGTLTYTVAGSTGELAITGSNSFAQINFSDVTNARSLKFTAGTTTTIRNGNGFNVRGTSGKLMTVASITAATHTLTSSNQQSTDYVSITNSIVNATPKWYAGANSTDGTGNTNWIFTNSPESVNSFTLYSSQYCLNFIYGTPDTQYSLQEIANLYNGTPSTRLSFQEVLNNRAGLQPNARSEQEALFQNVKTVLGLSDPYTLYSVQYLLNLCKARGIGLSTIFG